jgi:hypothetical protein
MNSILSLIFVFLVKIFIGIIFETSLNLNSNKEKLAPSGMDVCSYGCMITLPELHRCSPVSVASIHPA